MRLFKVGFISFLIQHPRCQPRVIYMDQPRESLYIKRLSLAGYVFPTIISIWSTWLGYETCIHNIQLQSCYDSRGRAWVNIQNFVVLLFISNLYHASLWLTRINIHTYILSWYILEYRNKSVNQGVTIFDHSGLKHGVLEWDSFHGRISYITLGWHLGCWIKTVIRIWSIYCHTGQSRLVYVLESSLLDDFGFTPGAVEWEWDRGITYITMACYWNRTWIRVGSHISHWVDHIDTCCNGMRLWSSCRITYTTRS